MALLLCLKTATSGVHCFPWNGARDDADDAIAAFKDGRYGLDDVMTLTEANDDGDIVRVGANYRTCDIRDMWIEEA